VSATNIRPRIVQLPPAVVKQIQAGEVIDRPASVLKELLENSLDAGATRIEIDVEGGGVERLCVVDDGCGIDADDLPLAFASHATSKLRNAQDLLRIGTLGFRGEALASIGGVAQVALQSRRAGEPFGHEIACHGGDLSPVRAWNGSPGTRVDVRHLFFNTPPRRKFLRSTATEMGHIIEAFTRLALSQPTAHWVLRNHGKLIHEIPASATLADRVGLFFGAGVRGRLYAIDSRDGAVRLSGLIADPSCERGNTKLQYLFVNGRWVRDRSLAHALQEAYRGLLMTGRYAVAFLFLELPPELVDVNVHPTKSEVRFRDAQALYQLVLDTVRGRLHPEDLTADLQPPAPPSSPPPSPAVGEPSLPIDTPPLWARSEPWPRGEWQGERVRTQPRSPAPGPSSSSAFGDPAPSGNAQPVSRDQPVRALQLYDTYLVVEAAEGMLVIDQHALHERILFEQLKARFRDGPLDRQRLLVPEPVDLSAEEAGRLLEQREALGQLGLEVEEFGGGTVLVTASPAVLGKRPPAETLRAVVDRLTAQELPSREVLLNSLLSLMACHAAVRAGDRLTPEEISALVARRALADDTHHCPHGRPTALLFSKHELERQFRRV
jgi:DNA mismatch repair protein MutL